MSNIETLNIQGKQMKILILNKQISIFLLLLTGIILFGNRNVFSQTNANQLANNIRDYIGNYYTEDLQVSANNNGIVTVTGQVNTLFDKLRIGELIASMEGVKGIKNNLQVLNDITADDEIKANIEDELKINDAISEPEKIHVDVKNGVVTLSGTVNYYREKIVAQTIASWQDGVNDLISKITVLPPAVAKSDSNLKTIISDVLKRHFPLEKNLWFEINNGKVTLDGKVTNLYAKDNIQDEIQKILGVSSVENNLTVANNF